MKYNINIFKKDCNLSDAEDRSLPLNSYLVEYQDEGATKFDIVIAHKQVDIFDYYYDNFFKIVAISWTNGKVNPKLWENPNQKKKK